MRATLKNIRATAYLVAPQTMNSVLSKLPPTAQTNWITHKRRNPQAGLDEFIKWYEPHYYSASTRLATMPAPSKQRVNHHGEASEPQKEGCPLCRKTNHKLSECRRFAAKDLNGRWETVKKVRWCSSCLDGRHWFKECELLSKCGKDGCQKEHHQLLHKNQELQEKPAEINAHHHDTMKTFYRVVPVKIINGKKSVATWAFLDEGSGLTLMSQSVAKKLELPEKPKDLTLAWSDGTTRNLKSGLVEIKLQGVSEPTQYDLWNVHTVPHLDLPTPSLNLEDLKVRYAHLNDVRIPEIEAKKPEILIGLEHAKLMVPQQVREGLWNEPVATKTRIGWAVYGRTRGNASGESYSCTISECEAQPREGKLAKINKPEMAIGEPPNTESKDDLVIGCINSLNWSPDIQLIRSIKRRSRGPRVDKFPSKLNSKRSDPEIIEDTKIDTPKTPPDNEELPIQTQKETSMKKGKCPEELEPLVVGEATSEIASANSQPMKEATTKVFPSQDQFEEIDASKSAKRSATGSTPGKHDQSNPRIEVHGSPAVPMSCWTSPGNRHDLKPGKHMKPMKKFCIKYLSSCVSNPKRKRPSKKLAKRTKIKNTLRVALCSDRGFDRLDADKSESVANKTGIWSAFHTNRHSKAVQEKTSEINGKPNSVTHGKFKDETIKSYFENCRKKTEPKSVSRLERNMSGNVLPSPASFNTPFKSPHQRFKRPKSESSLGSAIRSTTPKMCCELKSLSKFVEKDGERKEVGFKIEKPKPPLKKLHVRRIVSPRKTNAVLDKLKHWCRNNKIKKCRSLWPTGHWLGKLLDRLLSKFLSGYVAKIDASCSAKIKT
jgi:hypothetical protein